MKIYHRILFYKKKYINIGKVQVIHNTTLKIVTLLNIFFIRYEFWKFSSYINIVCKISIWSEITNFLMHKFQVLVFCF